MKNDQLGTKLGPRLAHLISNAIVDTQRKMMPTKHKLGMHLFEAMSDQISGEVDTALRPILEQMLADEKLPDELRAHLEFMAHGSGQLKALVGSSLAGAGLLQPLATLITNYLNPTVLNIIGATPWAVPDPGTIAQIYASGADTRQGLEWAMNGQGFNTSWVDDLFETALNYPDWATTLDLLRRNYVTKADARKYMRRGGIPDTAVTQLLAMQDVPPSPADLALAVLRGNMTDAEGKLLAGMSGVSDTDFEMLVNNTGEPPGIMELLEAYRRGFINQGTLHKGILQSRVRNEWIPTIEKLRYSPMSTADAVTAVVQNQISDAAGKKISDENGLDPAHWANLVNTAGEPLSRTEMEQLFNRGLVTKNEVIQALRESRLKNKYTTHAFDLHSRLIPERTVSTMLHHGTIPHADAVKRIMELGYDATSAALFVKDGSASKTAAHKQLAVGTITTLYEEKGITRAAAVTMLGKLGYEVVEADFLLEVADLRAKHRLTDQAITTVRGRYVSRHITGPEAIGHLDKIGMATAQRDQLMTIWGIERATNVRTLTEAQVIHVMKKTLITVSEAETRLINLGYSAADAALLIAGA